MIQQSDKWATHYKQTIQNAVYPTEWVIRTIAGANYPKFKFNKELYKGKSILDASCGDGRNLQLLINLGFEVFATETNEDSMVALKSKFPNVTFDIGFNHKMPFGNNYFDFVLSCGAFYYLNHNTTFRDNLVELNRILKRKGVFFANMSKPDTYVLKNAIKLENGEYLITNDPHNFRNGYRWQVVNNRRELRNIFKPYLKIKAIGDTIDNYFGYNISNFIIVCENIKSIE